MNNLVNLLKLQFNSLFAIKKNLIFILVFGSIFAFTQPTMITFAGAMYLMLASYSVIFYEERSKMNYLIYSLPITIKEYIFSRYIYCLINTLIANTKVEGIDSTTGDPFWIKAEMIYLQALFYYVIRHYDKRHQNFTTILKLIRLSSPNGNGVSELDELFFEWEKIEPDAIGVKQYKHFKVAAGTPKMMSTIIMTATARLAVFNIKEIHELTDDDRFNIKRNK